MLNIYKGTFKGKNLNFLNSDSLCIFVIFKPNFRTMKTKTFGTAFFQTIVICLFLSKTVFANMTGTSGNIYKQLTAIKCDSLIKANEANPNFVILDVRTPTEWSSNHLMGSINRSTGLVDFTAQLDALPKHKLFLLHCQSGGRSAGAFTKMKELGFAEVYEMIGGLNAWNNAKLPTTTVKGPKLMLVSKSSIISSSNTDTIKITITNRANEKLTFSSVSVSDLHPVNHNFNNSIAIDGAQDYTFSVFHSPNYLGIDSTKVKLESNGGNLNVSILFKDGAIVGIEDQHIAELTVFPNPASTKFFIKGQNERDFDEISIMSLTGKLVLTKNNVYANDGIDISQLQNGIYVVRIKSGQQTVSKKLVIQK
jgi:rhodanese-related sulfurtransferase